MSRWFRHYAGMMRDDKLVRVAMLSKQPVERVVWIWGAILESAAEINDDGRYDVDPSEVAYFLRADESDIRTIFDALATAARVADGRVVKWSDRQYQSDRSATRQSAYRERQRSQGSHSDNHEGASDGLVTVASRHGDAPDTDTETDKEKLPPAGASREAYSRDFDELWATYKPIASKNATKVDASRAFERLSAPDRRACLAGLRSYVEWLIAERRKRPETPAKHLATFINKRGWEPFAEQQALDATAPKQEWITVDNPRWQPLAEQWKRSHGGRDPPTKGGQGGTGWYFPVEPAPLSG